MLLDEHHIGPALFLPNFILFIVQGSLQIGASFLKQFSQRRRIHSVRSGSGQRVCEKAITLGGFRQLGVFSSKTATCLVRYCPDEVACILDSKAARSGRPLESFLGIGAGIPIVASVKEGLKYKPNQLTKTQHFHRFPALTS